MKPVRIEKLIKAPPEAVFDVIAHIDNFQHAIDDIVEVKFLGDTQRGRGAVFEETRRMGGREAKVVMEVVEYEPPQSLRIVSRPDKMGTVWETNFTLTPVSEHTRLNLEMNARAQSWFPKLMNALFSGMIEKAVAKDMASLKRYCETNQ